MQGALKVSLVIAISLMTVTSVLVLPTGRAADTSDVPVTEIADSPADASFDDVAWTPDGKLAIWVGADGGTGTGCIYRYDPSVSGAGAWQMLFVGGSDPLAGIIRTVVWDPYDGMFVAVGDAYPNVYWYAVDAGCTNIWEYSANTAFGSGGQGYDLAVDEYANRLICVGYKGSTGAAAGCFQFTPGSQTWSLLFTGGDDESIFRGVAVYPMTGDLYVVGSNYPSMCGLYYRYSSGVATWIGPGGVWNWNDYQEIIFSDIAYNQVAIAMVLTVESRTSSVAGIWYSFSSGPYGAFSDLVGMDPETPYNQIYKCIEHDNFSGYMFIVGYLDGVDYGRVYVLWRDTMTGGLHWKQVSTDGASMLGYNFLSVSIRPARIPMALIAGSAFAYYYTSANSGIQVNVVAPHINFVDIYGAGTSTSYVNSPVDIDDGSNTIGYDVTLSAYHSAGQGYISNVELSLWRDAGSESMPAGFADAGYGNTRARYVWNRGAPDSWSVICPTVTGTEEITLVPAQCSRVDEVDGQNVTIKFRVYFHQQARAAMGPFTEGPGARNADQSSDVSAYNNLNSWNIWMHAADTGGGIDYAYDEFGMYQYTYIGASGLPGGGAISGSGAPGLTVNLNPAGDITYSANCPYRLSGSVTDLTGQNLLGTISATTFYVLGGNLILTSISGADVPVYFYGSAVPTYQNPLDSERTTTTSTGDFNPDIDPVTWYCTIPTVAEDRYVGTITYTISHG